MNIGIVGLGLMGGSMAKSIKLRTGHTVYGIDLNSETMLLARLCGAIDGELDAAALSECDIIFIAVRPQAAVNWLEANAKDIKKEAIVIDFCGVKRSVCPQMREISDENGFFYIGGHPMAGKERGKFQNASDSLYVGASMILTPDDSTRPQTLEMLESIFTDVGFARVVYSNPAEHDRIIAYTSQLAHIVSSAYVKSPEAQRQRGFSAGSFKDMTRVAFLDEDMWTELFLCNKDHLVGELEILIENLSDYLKVLQEGDEENLRKLLREGREKKTLAGGN